MEFMLYDAGGRPIAYCDDGRHLYAFSGAPLAYLDGESVYAFQGHHLGWWDRGWVRDHQGACVFFTDAAEGAGPILPTTHPRPAKGAKHAPPARAYKLPKPMRVLTAENFRRDLTVELDIRSIHGGSCAIAAPTRQ